MARKKSYFAKANRGKASAVLVNNIVASIQESRREAAKKEAQDARRQEREDEQASKRRAREAEAAAAREAKEEDRKRQRDEKERERAAKLDEKRRITEEANREKFEKYQARSKVEFEKMGIYPGQDLLEEISREALKIGITVAQIKKYLIEDREDKWREKGGISLVEKSIKENYRNGETYRLIMDSAITLEKQNFLELLSKSEEFQELVHKQESRENIEREQKHLFTGDNDFIASLFSDDLLKIWEYADDHNLSVSEIRELDLYVNKVNDKIKYKEGLQTFLFQFQ